MYTCILYIYYNMIQSHLFRCREIGVIKVIFWDVSFIIWLERFCTSFIKLILIPNHSFHGETYLLNTTRTFPLFSIDTFHGVSCLAIVIAWHCSIVLHFCAENKPAEICVLLFNILCGALSLSVITISCVQCARKKKRKSCRSNHNIYNVFIII